MPGTRPFDHPIVESSSIVRWAEHDSAGRTGPSFPAIRRKQAFLRAIVELLARASQPRGDGAGRNAFDRRHFDGGKLLDVGKNEDDTKLFGHRVKDPIAKVDRLLA